MGKPISEIEKLTSTIPSDSTLELSLLGGSSSLHMENNHSILFPNYQVKGILDMEMALMAETATNAMDELIKLLRIDEPLWTKSSTVGHGQFSLHRDSYEKIFPMRDNHLRSPSSAARFESSKHSGMVTMSAAQLVDMLLDSVRII